MSDPEIGKWVCMTLVVCAALLLAFLLGHGMGECAIWREAFLLGHAKRKSLGNYCWKSEPNDSED